jgi:hypothetical protein
MTSRRAQRLSKAGTRWQPTWHRAHLGRDAGVVRPGDPERVVPKHAVPGRQAGGRVSYRLCACGCAALRESCRRRTPGGLLLATHQRVRQSSIAVVRAWPRWSEPVTLGGGITITNFSVLLVSFSTVCDSGPARAVSQWPKHPSS